MIWRAIVLTAVLSACATTGGATPESSSSAANATDFTLRDVDGRDVRLSDFSGKVVLLDFWATWCQPCEAEIPHLQALYKTYKDKGFVVLGISMDGPESVALVGPFVHKYSLEYPVLLDEETKVTGTFNPKRAAPLTVLIDGDGRIVRTRAGYSPGDERLIEEDIRRLLKI